MIAIIVVSTAFALVACNKPDSSSGETLPKVNISEGMTVDEVKTELAKVVNFTVQGKDSDGDFTLVADSNKGIRYTIDQDGVSAEYLFVGEIDNRLYIVYPQSKEYRAVDVKGLDVDLPETIEIGFDLLENLIEQFNLGNYTLSDGKIVDEKGNVFKDFNTTEWIVPAYMDEYKSKETTENAVDYNDIDETTCELEDANLNFNSFTVPDSHNGKTVVGIGNDARLFTKKLTIGKNITYLPSFGNGYRYTKGMEVTYLGTKEDWKKITNSSVWENYDITIVCSDGEIEK